jgi:hypothetical protein
MSASRSILRVSAIALLGLAVGCASEPASGPAEPEFAQARSATSTSQSAAPSTTSSTTPSTTSSTTSSTSSPPTTEVATTSVPPSHSAQTETLTPTTVSGSVKDGTLDMVDVTSEPPETASITSQPTDADSATSSTEPTTPSVPPATQPSEAPVTTQPLDLYQPPGGVVNVGVVDIHGTVHMWNGPDDVMVIPECGSKNPYIFTMRFEYDNGEIDTITKELFPGPDANPTRGWFFDPWGFELPVPVRVSWRDGADYMVCFL